MAQARVSYRVEGHLARLVIQQPDKMNAMTYDMWAALPDLVASADADPAVRAIVIEGEGDKAFCAGADISQFGEKRTGAEASLAYDGAVSAGVHALIGAAKPSVAVIRGICFGGGFVLALACDIRLARADARFRVPAARLGLGYSYGNVEMMVSRLSRPAVADMLFSARILDAQEALRLGAVSRVLPTGTFEDEARVALTAIEENAPLTLAALKASMVELEKPEGLRDPERARALTARCYTSADYAEGQAAFRDKRTPVFRGA
jgi:enoyl-CoA hydratase/carnithine racemase